VTIDQFFSGYDQSAQIYEAISRVIESIGPAEVRVSKSQIAFVNRRPFAWVWIPERYLHRKSASLVLTLGFRYGDGSPGWKQIVEPAKGQFTHHMELNSTADIDDEVQALQKTVWTAAAEFEGKFT
jgi:hypothetical protein